MDALGDIRVLDLTRGIAGPLGVLLLADLGADVTKVEPADGGLNRDSPEHRVWDRSRRSAAIDLSSVEGKEQYPPVAEDPRARRGHRG